MMKNVKKKNLCLAAAALTLTAGLSVGTAMAYFTTYATASGGVSLSLDNAVTVPEEEVSNWTKHITVQNTGDIDCFVRVKVFAGDKYQDGLTYADDEGRWTPGADDCYYYSDIVPAGGASQELRVGIDPMDSEESFNVIVVQECTPVLYDEEGNPYADWNRVMDSDQTVYAEEGEE